MEAWEDRLASSRSHEAPQPTQAHHMLPRISEEEKILYAAAAQASRFDRLAAHGGAAAVGSAGERGIGGAGVGSSTESSYNAAASYAMSRGNSLVGNSASLPKPGGLTASLEQPLGSATSSIGLNGLNRFAGLTGGAGAGGAPQDDSGAFEAIHEAAANRAAHARAAAYAAYAEAELAYREAVLAASVNDRMALAQHQAQQQQGHDLSTSAAAAVLALSGGRGGSKGGERHSNSGGVLPPHSSPAYANSLAALGANEEPRRIPMSSALRLDPNDASVLNSSPHLRAMAMVSREEEENMRRGIQAHRVAGVGGLPARDVEPSPLPRPISTENQILDAADPSATIKTKPKQTRQVKPGGKKRGRKPGSKNKPKPIDALAASASGATGQKRKRRKKRNKKPKDMPKRPLSAYNIYFREQRTKILDSLPTPAAHGGDAAGNNDGDESRQEDGKDWDTPPVVPAACLGGEPRSLRLSRPHGKISFQELAKIIGRNWKEMGDEHRAGYKNLAAQDSLRYKEEMEAWHLVNSNALVGATCKTNSEANKVKVPVGGEQVAYSVRALRTPQAGADPYSTDSSNADYAG